MEALQLSVPKRKHAMPSDNARYDVSHWPVADPEHACGQEVTRPRAARASLGTSALNAVFPFA